MRKIAIRTGVVSGVILLAWCFGLIGIHYPCLVDNQALENPLKVEVLNGDIMVLDDGRRIQLEGCWCDGGWELALEESGQLIEVEHDGDDLIIFGNLRRSVCGTPWVNLINLPLIEVELPKNQRQVMGWGSEAR